MARAHDNIVVERGTDPSALLLVFSGLAGRWGGARYEFLDTARHLRFSRILCRDQRDLAYLAGIGDEPEAPPRTAARLRAHIDELAPQTTIVVGNSIGAFAALLYGHLLGADYVHAFSPLTSLAPAYVRDHRTLDTDDKRDFYDRLWRETEDASEWYELRDVLAHDNAHTAYYLHYCRDSALDTHAAQWVDGLPGMHLFDYPCHHHFVSRHLLRAGLLLPLLNPQRQPQVPEMIRGKEPSSW